MVAAPPSACDFTIGAKLPVQLIVIPPLFFEANRSRRLIVTILHHLADRGIGGRLLDLPGTGESLVDLAAVQLADWRAAVSAAASEMPVPPLTIAFRGGALVDDAIGGAPRWRLSPVDGAAVVRALRRASSLGGNRPPRLAGYPLGAALLADLAAATLPAGGQVRTVRLADDPATADRHLPGTPLWHRAEPGEDAALAVLLADDIHNWTVACAAL